jgi:hypothetical protein
VEVAASLVVVVETPNSDAGLAPVGMIVADGKTVLMIAWVGVVGLRMDCVDDVEVVKSIDPFAVACSAHQALEETFVRTKSDHTRWGCKSSLVGVAVLSQEAMQPFRLDYGVSILSANWRQRIPDRNSVEQGQLRIDW